MRETIDSYLKISAEAVSSMSEIADEIEKAAGLLIDSYKNGGKALIFGNGGSAADSQHIATELVSKFRRVRPAIPALALTTNTSLLTAIGNDFGFDDVFSRQVEACAEASDVAVAISTSGDSENVIKGIESARRRKIPVIGFTSREGGKMKDLCDVLISAPLDLTSHVQECHITAAHIICELVEKELFGDK